MASKKIKEEVVTFYSDQFDDSFAIWRGEPSPEERGISSGYAAFHALAYAAFLERAGDRNKMLQLESLSTEQRTALLTDACAFAAGFEAPAELVVIFDKDVIDGDDIDFVELTLGHRDELDLFIEAAKQVAGPDPTDVVLNALASAVIVACDLDDLLLTQPELMAVCSRSLLDVRSSDWLRNGSYPDWFAISRKWDDEQNAEGVDALVETTLRDPKDNLGKGPERLDAEAWRHLSGQSVALPIRERVLRFELKGDLAMVAATPQSKLVLHGEGSELWILQHGDPDLLNVRLKSPANVQVGALLLDGVPVELVEDWDDEQEAVVGKVPVMRTLQSGGEIQVRVREDNEND